MAPPNMWKCCKCGAPNPQSFEVCYYCKTARPPAQAPTRSAHVPSNIPVGTENRQAPTTAQITANASQATANVVTALGNMVSGCIGIAVNLFGILLVWMFCG